MIVLAAGMAGMATTAAAQDLPPTSIRVIGNFSTQVQVRRVEKPF